ncbi:MAG: Multiple sugar transport system substrate-binding protein, partial [Parcubacteria group bacterium GW2011_GWA2_48_9]
MRRGYLFVIGGGLVVILILVALFLLGGRKPVNVQPVSLEWWGVFDDTADVESIINAYRTNHPYITITYKKFRYEEYEDSLIQAWARGSGPDIFAIPNSWVHKFQANGFLTPMPLSTRMAFYSLSRPLGIKQELKIEYRDVPSLTTTDIANRFVQTVQSDTIINGGVYGLPLSMDTLALFYNRDLLNFAVITQPPATWNEFLDAITRLTLLDTAGGIVQAGAALGTYDNIPRAFDIISVLMMQNGAQMVNEQLHLSFNQAVPGSSDAPGVQALQFYTDFAQPTKQAYTWNVLMPDAFEAFVNGQVAFFVGYQYHRDLLRDRSGRVSWSVSTLPQVDSRRPVNYAN